MNNSLLEVNTMAELKDKELNEVVGGIDWNNNSNIPTEPGNYKLPSDVELNDTYIPLPSDEKLKS